VALGYIFVAPYPSFEPDKAVLEQPAAYIFGDNGNLVWSGPGYLGCWVGNFQAARYKGRPVLQAFQGTVDRLRGHGFGTVALLNETYQQIATVQSRNKLMDLYEFRIVNEETALVEIYRPTPYDLGPYAGRGGSAVDWEWHLAG